MFGEIYKGKTVLVTGYQGFCGSWLCAWLSHLGASVIGYGHLARTDPNHFQALKKIWRIVDAEMVYDLKNYDGIQTTLNVYKPDIVFHLAAKAIVARTFKEPRETFENNIMSTVNVLEAIRTTTKCPIVIVTSDKVYDNQEWKWGYRENDKLGGVDPYSASKTCIEHVIQSYRDCFELFIGVARAGNVIGGGDWSEKRLIPDLIRATVKKETTIVHTLTSSRPWQHVLEALQGYLLLGKYLLEIGDNWQGSPLEFNFGPIEERTVRDLLQVAKNVWPQITWDYSGIPTHPHMVYRLVLDATQAKEVLGWKPVWSFHYTIMQTIEWYRRFYEDEKVTTFDQIVEYEECLNDRG